MLSSSGLSSLPFELKWSCKPRTLRPPPSASALTELVELLGPVHACLRFAAGRDGYFSPPFGLRYTAVPRSSTRKANDSVR
jgi:hypothetical protein